VETLIVAVAVVLIALGLFGLSPLLLRRKRVLPPLPHIRSVAASKKQQILTAPPLPELPLPAAPPAPVAPVRAGHPSEVDYLRAQLDQLRSELFAVATPVPPRFERPRLRRYRTGVYSHLPRDLRRHVKEVRQLRHHAV
jgi:hypothetical protein